MSNLPLSVYHIMKLLFIMTYILLSQFCYPWFSMTPPTSASDCLHACQPPFASGFFRLHVFSFIPALALLSLRTLSSTNPPCSIRLCYRYGTLNWDSATELILLLQIKRHLSWLYFIPFEAAMWIISFEEAIAEIIAAKIMQTNILIIQNGDLISNILIGRS